MHEIAIPLGFCPIFPIFYSKLQAEIKQNNENLYTLRLSFLCINNHKKKINTFMKFWLQVKNRGLNDTLILHQYNYCKECTVSKTLHSGALWKRLRHHCRLESEYMPWILFSVLISSLQKSWNLCKYERTIEQQWPGNSDWAGCIFSVIRD